MCSENILQLWSSAGTYSSTDSHILKNKTGNVSEHLRNLKQTFGLANLNTTHPLDDISFSQHYFTKEIFSYEFAMAPLDFKVYGVKAVCYHQYEFHERGYCKNNTGCKLHNKNILTHEKIVLKVISKVAKSNIPF